ncbi:hypothetical protein [Flaviaesturariibacter aridisoli]|uniref:hypothetical protein n=1 Tax=Flaviaesturariibacter aridisoli TaxID=2545761 RepID=UPI0014054F6C
MHDHLAGCGGAFFVSSDGGIGVVEHRFGYRVIGQVGELGAYAPQQAATRKEEVLVFEALQVALRILHFTGELGPAVVVGKGEGGAGQGGHVGSHGCLLQLFGLGDAARLGFFLLGGQLELGDGSLEALRARLEGRDAGNERAVGVEKQDHAVKHVEAGDVVLFHGDRFTCL